MYEEFFGLARRPYSATPDASCFLSIAATQAIFDELVVVAEENLGIGILTAPAGVGKTLFCERIVAELRARYQVIFLRHAKFMNRKALLQTLLHELQRPYQQTTEQELRLALLPALRDLRKKNSGVVIIADEAHELTEPLLEELRTLTDLAEDGKAFVRLILSGQPTLEEKLTSPSLSALNQRVGTHLTLSPLSQQESWDYIDYRLTWAGGRTDEILSAEALQLIAEASDGLPRCLNQLCDHSLLLAYVSECKPVTVAIVRDALRDLKHLPLHWNTSSAGIGEAETSYEPTGSDSGGSSDESEASVAEFHTESRTDRILSSILETGHDIEHIIEYGSEIETVIDHIDHDDKTAGELKREPAQPPRPVSATKPALPQAFARETLLSAKLGADGFHEAEILDRYAAIDAGWPLPVEPAYVETVATTSTEVCVSLPAEEQENNARPLMSHWDQPLPWATVSPTTNSTSESNPWDMPSVTADFLAAGEQIDSAEPSDSISSSLATTTLEIAVATPVIETLAVETEPVAETESHSFRNLFTRLRQKQRHQS